MSNTTSKPFVSLCTITNNRQHLLPRLMDCIQTQDYPSQRMEWVIYDDSRSSLDCRLLNNESGINLNYHWSNTKVSLGTKRNKSHQLCQGDIIVILDDDDFYPSTRVSHAIETLTKTDKLVAGCSSTLILYLDIGELWINGPYGQGFSLANSMAFKKEVLNTTQCDPESTINEEQSFLKNYTLPMAQLDPTKTIVCISHGLNTANSASLRIQQQNGEANMNLRPFQYTSQSQETAIKELCRLYRELHETQF